MPAEAVAAPYTVVRDPAAGAVPDRGMASRTLVDEGGVRTTLMAMAEGEELGEHTAARAVWIVILRGRARFGLGEDVVELRAGDQLRMAAGLHHSVKALEPLAFMLTALPPGLA